ncbi:hypothetical protein [Azospirillum sp. A39]|uniref:hypothetical protein n=1 Tax=Azospirillum sp. A39 TaxID=3462279 RepID=UPI0040456FB4
MRLHSDPTSFSITALLADQVTLIVRHEGLPPGAARLLLDRLTATPEGRRRLLRIFEREMRREADPREAAKIALVRTHTADWFTEDETPDDERTAA